MRVKLPPDEHGTSTIRGRGFRGGCACGTYFPVRETVTLARRDVDWHKLWHEAVAYNAKMMDA